MKRKQKWIQVAHTATNYYVNGNVYTDLDEPLRLARRFVNNTSELLRIWTRNFIDPDQKPNLILLSPYRLSDVWGTAHTEKMSGEEIWPIFESYVRML